MQTATIPSNADIAAELAAMSDGAPQPEVKEPPAEVDAADTEVEADTNDEPVKEPEPEPEPDPATARSLAMIAKADERARKKLAEERNAQAAKLKEEREALERERAEVAAARKALDAFEKIKARARYEPDAVLAELGLSDEDMEHAAKAAWARSKAGASDPKQRDAVARSAQQRERDDRIAAAEKRAEAAEKRAEEAFKRIEEREQAARTEVAVNNYLDTASKAITPTAAPLVAKWAEKSPAKVRQVMHAVAVELAEANDEPPSPADLVAEVERRRRADLEDSGIDIAAILGAPKKPTPPGPSRTLERGGGGASTPKPKLAGAELVDDIKRAVESGKFDDA